MTLRVLHVMEALEGGTARHLRDLVRWTPDVEQHVAVPAERVGGETDREAIPAMRAAGATVHEVPMTRRPPSRANARALGTLHALVRALDADLVHAHSSIGGVLGRLAARTSGRPAVYTPNGLYDNRATLAVERALGRVTTRFIAVSQSEADDVRRRRLVDPGRLVVVPNGVDPAPTVPERDLRLVAGIPADAPLVVCVGRLIEQKQPLVAIDALLGVLARRPDCWALVVGAGPLRREVLARAGGHPRLRHVDVVPDVAAGLASADVVLLLSAFEGAPYVPLEAMRAGTPVVVSDVVGNRDAVRIAGGGILVPAGEPAVATDAVVRLLADPAERTRLGEQGASGVRSALLADRMGARTRAVYDDAVRQRVLA